MTELTKQQSETAEFESVIYHDGDHQVESAGDIFKTSQSVPPQPASTSQPTSRVKSDSKSGTYHFQIHPPKKRGMHGREASVGNLIPQSYLAQASSLIQLIDASKSRAGTPSFTSKNIPFRTIDASRSVPDYNLNGHKEQTPSMNSDDDYDEANGQPLTPVPEQK
eukprot:258476_1